MRALAALLRAGFPARTAISLWPSVAPERLRHQLEEVSRRVRLGDEAAAALGSLGSAMGPDARALACAVAVHSEMGGDLATVVDGLADAAEDRAAALAAGKASGAGAVLSGRIVAGLPLLLVPFAPLSGSSLLDPFGLVLLLGGGALAVAGMRWVGRLVPVPPAGAPEGVVVADVLACVLDGGVALYSALAAVALHAPDELRGHLTRARRRVRLGDSWPDALNGTGNPSLQALSSELRRAVALGTPLSPVLKRWSGSQRAAARREFDAAMRRAPVLMVVPLSLCVLPAYALLGLAPYIRGLL
jgi:tight adherence protein B